MAELDDSELPRVILGCQPFIGESYQGAERNKEYAKRFSAKENVVAVLVKAAKEYGVTALAAVPANANPLAGTYLKAVNEAERTLGTEFSLAPCLSIPLIIRGTRVDDYRRWLTYYLYERERASEELGAKFLSDPILLTRPGWSEGFRRVLAEGKPYGRDELEELEIDFSQWEKSVGYFEGKRTLFAEPGSETDFLAVTGRFKELQELADSLRHRGFARVFFGVHHAGVTIPLLERSGIRFEGYVTPVNQIGALMFPSAQTALEAIESTRRQVVAIKTMAGGRVPPREAFNYLFRRAGIRSCMVGVGSLKELDADMRAVRDVIGSIRDS